MAINITRVYTRGGDKGQTSLVGGTRVDKDCLQLEACGDVDEANCWVGTARAAIAVDRDLPKAARGELDLFLRWVQNRLFDVGSLLATEAGASYPNMPAVRPADWELLEEEMDRMQKALKPLPSFCLPGGTAANAALHHCRAVCRRAERHIVRLARSERVDADLRKFVNRLSDYFFVAARYVSKRAGAPEFLWEYGAEAKGRSRPARSKGPAGPAAA